MTKTNSGPGRAELGALRDDLNQQRLRAEGWLQELLHRVKEAQREADAFRREGLDPDRVIRNAEVFPPGVQGAVRSGGPVSYHLPGPSPEDVGAARDALTAAESAYEDACGRFDKAPVVDPIASAEAAGARFVAGRTFDFADRHFWQGDPVAPSDLPGIDGRRLRSLVKSHTLIDAHPFADLVKP